jgi:hypothetical protein
MTMLALGASILADLRAQKPPIDPSPVELPGHRYELPATLITAAQIEEHKQNMVAVDETDVAITMVKQGGRLRSAPDGGQPGRPL